MTLDELVTAYRALGPHAYAGPGGITTAARARDRSWYRIENAARPANAGAHADLYVYAEIGAWGVEAAYLVEDLRQLDVATLTVHINSPGGDAFDGVAIYNSLVAHQATVTCSVEGMAASAASVIAMAGDEIVMQPGSMMMIHNASGLCWGEASDMRALADLLDQVSESIAGLYRLRAGGEVAGWLAAMAATTWYTAAEAVAAGLATRVGGVEQPDDTTVVETAPDPETGDEPRRYHDTRGDDGRFAPAETDNDLEWLLAPVASADDVLLDALGGVR